MPGRILSAALDLLFPPICILCRRRLLSGERDVQFCASCMSHIRRNPPPFCRQCPRPLDNPGHPLCPTCRRKRLHFDRAWSACIYFAPLPHLLHLFKYGGKTSLRRLFAAQMCRYLDDYGLLQAGIDIVIPLPLHPTRRRERGYNQAELLSQPLAEHLHLPHRADLLLRRRHTPNQARLQRNDRWTNIHGAFTIKPSLPVKGKNVLLIDDLLTTGATASAAAGTLKDAGAGKVYVFTLAMAL